MGLSRRALFPAALGGALAAPEALEALKGDLTQVSQAVPLPPGSSYLNPDWAQKVAQERRDLLDAQSRMQRWARGDFREDELSDGLRYDNGAHTPHYDHAPHEIASLKSVSSAHKMRMSEALRRERYIRYRRQSALNSLPDIIKRLAGL